MKRVSEAKCYTAVSLFCLSSITCLKDFLGGFGARDNLAMTDTAAI